MSQIGALTVSGVESWLAARRAADGYRVPTVRALRALLSYLGEVGVMGEEEPPALSPVEALVDEYRQWLIADRGLAAMTVLRYETLARRFLTARVTPTDELGVTGLDGAVVSRFLLGECDRVCLGSAKGKVAELRSLLQVPAHPRVHDQVVGGVGAGGRGMAGHDDPADDAAGRHRGAARELRSRRRLTARGTERC